MKEFKLHDLINNNDIVQQGICSALNINWKKTEFIHEDSFPNNMTVDFTIKIKNEVQSLLEVKGSDINITEYNRGIGQISQYQNFINEKVSTKGYDFNNNAMAVLIFPSSLIRKGGIDIWSLSYPKGTKILEVNDQTYAVREIEKKELKKVSNAINNNISAISQYYIRDNRIFELYILLRYLAILKFSGKKECKRKKLESEFLIRINTINNGNWRNAFISLSSLGFIDTNNMPTPSGDILAGKTYEEFVADLFEKYIGPYVQEIYNVLENLKDKDASLGNKDLVDLIRKNCGGKDILYLTESDYRYVSSWLNILRDDYGCIDFKSKQRNPIRKIIYNPCELNRHTLVDKIRENTIAYEYISRFESLLQQ